MSGTTKADLVAIDLTDDERYLIGWALGHWGGCASDAPLPVRLVGAANWDEFDALTDRLATAVKHGEALTDLDWARALFLTEISFGSDLIGAGVEFEMACRFADQDGLKLLRSLQRKIASHERAALLFPGAGRPRRTE
jgi:hypothetical protein